MCIRAMVSRIGCNIFLFAMYMQDLIQGFDQEAAAVVMARLASYKMEMEVTYSSNVINVEGYLSSLWHECMLMNTKHNLVCCIS